MGRTIVTERDIRARAATNDESVTIAVIDTGTDDIEKASKGHIASIGRSEELRQLIDEAEREGDVEKAETYRRQLRAKEEQAEGQPEPEEPYEDNEGEVTGADVGIDVKELSSGKIEGQATVKNVEPGGTLEGVSIDSIDTISPLASSMSPGIDGYVDKLLKYIPAESVVLYLTLQGIILSGAEGGSLALWLWAIFSIGVVGTPLYLWRIQKVSKMVQLAVSTAAFAIWVFALGGAFESLTWYEPFIGSVMLVVFTFCVPVIDPDLFSTNEE